jgi:hypothetical protein
MGIFQIGNWEIFGYYILYDICCYIRVVGIKGIYG